MTPQHYLLAAALIGPAETTTGTHILALGYCHLITFDPGKPATFGHLEHDARFCTLGPIGYPERFDAWETDPAKAQAHALNEWITEEHGHHNFRGSTNRPTTTRDALIEMLENGEAVEVKIHLYERTNSATTTLEALRPHPSNPAWVNVPEEFAPSYDPQQLDVCWMGWTWETGWEGIGGTNDEPWPSYWWPLFRLMAESHGLSLTGDECNQIALAVDECRNTNNPQTKDNEP